MGSGVWIWPPIVPPTSLPPSGPAGGQLSGTYPNPSVVGITETGGPTALAIGAIADGQVLVRSGATVVGAAPGGPPSGPAGGQLSGTYPNPSVVGITEGGATALSIATIADGELLIRSGATVDGITPAALAALIAALPAGYVSGLQLTRASNSTIDMAAGRARSSADAADIVLGGTVTIDITVVGANGRDAGAEAANTWYAIHVIDGPAVATAGLFSTSPTAPTLPAGYTVFRRVGWIRNNGASNFALVTWFGSGMSRRCVYSGENFANTQVLSGGSATAYTAVSAAAWVPPTSRELTVGAIYNGTSSNDIAELRQTGTAVGNTASTIRFQSDGVGDHGWQDDVTTDATQQFDYRVTSVLNDLELAVYAYTDPL